MTIDVTQLTTTPTHYPENHATIHRNVRNRVVIQMDAGWAFSNLADWDNEVDENGNPYVPLPEEIIYSRYGVFAPDTDFAKILVVDEATVNPEQIK